MIPSEMYVWFAGAMLLAAIVFFVGWWLTAPPAPHPAPRRTYERFRPAPVYAGRHRKDEIEGPTREYYQ